MNKHYSILLDLSAGVVIAASLFIHAGFSYSEDVITLNNGHVLTGKIKNENVTIIVLEVKGKPRIVRKAEVQSIKKVKHIEEQDEQPESPSIERGFIEVDDFILLPKGNYSYELGKAIDAAQKSIDVVMYYMSTASAFQSSPTDKLISKLIEANDRDVKVRVVVENQLVPKHVKEQNETVVKRLRDAGIDARLDVQKRITHSKLVIIDDYITFVGSHNWTQAGLSSNVELSCMIKSEKVAMAFMDHTRDILEKSE